MVGFVVGSWHDDLARLTIKKTRYLGRVEYLNDGSRMQACCMMAKYEACSIHAVNIYLDFFSWCLSRRRPSQISPNSFHTVGSLAPILADPLRS